MDSGCFILICKTDFSIEFVLQAEAEKPEKSRQKKICLDYESIKFGTDGGCFWWKD